MNPAWMLAAALSLAGTVSPGVPDERHVEHGRQFRSVARLYCKTNGSVVVRDGSCVLISPRVAVTAAHVVFGADSWEIIVDDGTRHDVISIVVHEDYERGNFGRGDIALCISEDSFGLDAYPRLRGDAGEAGKVADIVGYGMCGTFRDGRTKSDGLRRAGRNVIDSVQDGYLTCSAGDGDLEFLISPGDSGGGLFIDGELAGVNSFLSATGTSPPKGVYGDESGHTRISDYKSWIEKEARCAEGNAVRDFADRGRGLEEEEGDR